MNNVLKKYVLLFVGLFLSFQGQAQCAMCRAALESSDSGIKPEAVNDGIVYLMAFPYILVGLVGFAVYKLRKKKVAKAE